MKKKAALKGKKHPHDEQIAAIDFGSKTFKFVAGRRHKGKIKTRLLGKERVELGKNLRTHHDSISDKKLAEIDHILARFTTQCAAQGIQTILGIGTSAIRSAKNRLKLARLIRAHGVQFEIARGKREGDIGYLAATGGAPDQIVSDMGSRSFQVAYSHQAEINSVSLKAGYLVVYQRYYQQAHSFAEGDEKLRKLLRRHIRNLPTNSEQYRALASNSLACYLKSAPKHEITNRPLSQQLIKRKIAQLSQLNHRQYNSLKRKLDKADKILPGLTFIDYLLEITGQKEVFIAEAELPEGLIVEYFLKAGPQSG